MGNIRLTVQYDGPKSYGWQKLNNLPSVQPEIEKAMTEVVHQPVRINGVGGTDKGVYVKDQICNFVVDTNISANQFLMGVNHFANDSTVIAKSEEVDLDFHTRFNAKSKTYKCILYNKYCTEPWFNDYRGHGRYYLDFDLLLKCREMLIGKHNSTSPVSDLEEDIGPARITNEITIEKVDGDIAFAFRVESSLRDMVRILAGSMVDVAGERKSVDWPKNTLGNKDRQSAGITIESCGLYLMGIEY